LDAFYVVGKRLIRGRNPFTSPDRSHLHHRFLDAGFSPASTLITISVISLLFGLAGVLIEGRMKIYLIGILAVVTLAIFVLLDLLKLRIKNSK
jgi:UDP-GlcNAc:undecaprenyl-phosphate GlcNAc-1-phosphate transferase